MSRFALLVALVLSTAFAAPSRAQDEVHHLLGVQVGDPKTETLLFALGIPVECLRNNGVGEIVATDRDIAGFHTYGVAYILLQEDLQQFYAQRLADEVGVQINPPFGNGSMGGYHTLAEMESILDDFTSQFPGIASAKFSLGLSLENRDIWAIKISDNVDVDEGEPEVRIDSMHHAREIVSPEMSIFFIDWLTQNYGTDPLATFLVDEREIYVVPVVNPDGFEYNRQIAPNGGGLWRKNRRDNQDGTFGVDLNRNYSFQWGGGGSSGNTGSETYRGPAPFSEPETQAMRDFFDQRNFKIAMSAHTYSNLLLDPWGYTCSDHGNRAEYDLMGYYMTLDNSYVYGPICQVLYQADGNTVDYDWGVKGTWSKTVEIGGGSDGFWPPISRLVPLMEENLTGYQRLALYAGAGVEHDPFVWVETSGDGDGYYEPGEVFALTATLTNAGVQASVTDVLLTASSSSASLAVLDGSANFGSIPAHTSDDNNSDPLEVEVDAGAQNGESVTLTVELSYDGYSESVDLNIVLGQPRSVGSDDVELDFGWITGVPGDTADSGAWEIADPSATSSGGETIQPGDDHTVGGNRCAVTDGRSGSSAGTYDVDDGDTTLISPQFDLEDAMLPTIRYWRWFTSLGGTANDDEFTVDISNDDGATWVNVEVLGTTQNTWTEVAFQPTLPLTNQMRMRFHTADDPNNSLTEGLVDDLAFELFNEKGFLWRYGTPQTNSPIQINLSGQAGEIFLLFFAASGTSLPIGDWGVWELDPATMNLMLSGLIPGGGRLDVTANIPNNPALIGATPHFQAVLSGGSQGDHFSNAIDFIIE